MVDEKGVSEGLKEVEVPKPSVDPVLPLILCVSHLVRCQ